MRLAIKKGTLIVPLGHSCRLKNFVTFRRGITPVNSAKMRPKKRHDYASNDKKYDNVRNDEVVIVI
jgi:hypothetical protein